MFTSSTIGISSPFCHVQYSSTDLEQAIITEVGSTKTFRLQSVTHARTQNTRTHNTRTGSSIYRADQAQLIIISNKFLLSVTEESRNQTKQDISVQNLYFNAMPWPSTIENACAKVVDSQQIPTFSCNF